MTMLPPSTDFTGATITEGQFKTALTSLRTFLYEKLGDDGGVAIQAFASGTRMLFQQTSAPSGWTKDTTHNDKALRVVSGTVSSGGISAFSTVFGKTATDSHTLTTGEVPSHSHTFYYDGSDIGGGVSALSVAGLAVAGRSTSSTHSTTSSGSGGGHTHGMDIRVQYVDLIIAAKD